MVINLEFLSYYLLVMVLGFLLVLCSVLELEMMMGYLLELLLVLLLDFCFFNQKTFLFP